MASDRCNISKSFQILMIQSILKPMPKDKENIEFEIVEMEKLLLTFF
jgi:hypothetical protein